MDDDVRWSVEQLEVAPGAMAPARFVARFGHRYNLGGVFDRIAERHPEPEARAWAAEVMEIFNGARGSRDQLRRSELNLRERVAVWREERRIGDDLA
jgi:hypothetical protein